ncbi:MAG: S24 family peptidase [Flavobacteriales bacterium]
MLVKRFEINSRIIQLIDYLGISKNKFAKEIGISSGRMSNIATQRNKPDSEMLQIILERFTNVCAEWLILGKGPMFKRERPTREKIIVETVDTSGNRVIPVSNISAAAGFGLYNDAYAETKDFISLPARFLQSGAHVTIRLKGMSMTPTFHDGSFQIVRILERAEWRDMPKQFVGVVVDTEGKGYFKRIKNRIPERNSLILTSDHIDRGAYPNFTLDAKDIQTICYWALGLQFKAPNANADLAEKVSELESELSDLRVQIEGFSQQR